jgi:acyl carrier protein
MGKALPIGIAVTIEVQNFIENLERHLTNVAPGRLQSETRLRDLPEWDSLQALVVAASFDWDYGVTISADEFAGTQTIRDLHALVTQKVRQ